MMGLSVKCEKEIKSNNWKCFLEMKMNTENMALSFNEY